MNKLVTLREELKKLDDKLYTIEEQRERILEQIDDEEMKSYGTNWYG